MPSSRRGRHLPWGQLSLASSTLLDRIAQLFLSPQSPLRKYHSFLSCPASSAMLSILIVYIYYRYRPNIPGHLSRQIPRATSATSCSCSYVHSLFSLAAYAPRLETRLAGPASASMIRASTESTQPHQRSIFAISKLLNPACLPARLLSASP